MTTALESAPRLRLVLNVDDAQATIAGEVRAEMAKQRVTDTAIAAALGQNQQWFNRRKNGDVPFSAAELAAVASYLAVPIGRLYGEAQPTRPEGPSTPGGNVADPGPLAQSVEQRTFNPKFAPALAEVA